MLLGEDGIAGGHTTDHGNAETLPQSNAARGARQHLDVALALQRTQMIFGGVRRTKAELFGNFGAGRWKAGRLQEIGDQLQHFGLGCGQFIHGLPLFHCDYIQFAGKCKGRGQTPAPELGAGWRSLLRYGKPHAGSFARLRSDSRPTDSTTSGASLLATRTRFRLPHPSRALRWCVSTVSVRMSRIRLPCRAHQSIALESQRYEHRRKKIRDDASKPFGTLVAKHVHRTGGGT